MYAEDSTFVSEAFDNVWDAIYEDDPPERERQKLLSDLAIAIGVRIREKGWTQKQAAQVLGVTQPRVSNLLRMKLDVFSIDSLVAMAGVVGMRIELRYKFDP